MHGPFLYPVVMKLARLLAEVRIRMRTSIPEGRDPIRLILSQLADNGHTLEARALRKTVLAVIDTYADVTDADLWALGTDALGLLDAFATYRFTGLYKQVELDTIARKLRAEAPAA